MWLFYIIIKFYKNHFIIIIIIFFFMKIFFYFFMFRDVPGFSGMFRNVPCFPGFNDALRGKGFNKIFSCVSPGLVVTIWPGVSKVPRFSLRFFSFFLFLFV